MVQHILPSALKPGDGIALVSVSRFAEAPVIAQAEAWIQAHGWVAYRAPNLGAVSDQFGGTDAQRAEDVNWAIRHTEVKAIWSIRGGYGAVRMVDGIDWPSLLTQPKWLIGFSDFTMLLGHAFQQGICAVHSSDLIQAPDSSEASLQGLALLLAGNPQALKASAQPLNVQGDVFGPLFGGNLSVLYSMLGSSSFPSLKGCILALEDLDEYRYHLDRMCWGLRRAGGFEGLAGVALGSFSEMKDNARPFGKDPLEIITAAFPPNTPLACGLPFGHTSDNEPFVTGLPYRLTVGLSGATLSPA
ncbi:MAG TPA: LD-carboxypeptidase [Cryomorphaceae bacterium]|nr:LD-carboxypeptidase [Cryomorphaceae bacterium]